MRRTTEGLISSALLSSTIILLAGCTSWMPVSKVKPFEPTLEQQLPPAIIDMHAHFFNGCDASDAALWYLSRGGVKGAGSVAKHFGRRYLKNLDCSQRNTVPSVEELIIPESVGRAHGFNVAQRNLRYLEMTSAKTAAIAQTYRQLFPEVDVVMPALVDMDGWVHVGHINSKYRPLPGSGIERNKTHRKIFRELNGEDYKSSYSLIIPFAGFNPIRAIKFSCEFDESTHEDPEKRVRGCTDFWTPLREHCSQGEGCKSGLDTTGELYLQRFRKLLESGEYAGVKIYPSFGYTPGFTCERVWSAVSSGALPVTRLDGRGTLPWAPLQDAGVHDSLYRPIANSDCASLQHEVANVFGPKEDIHWQIALTAELDRVMNTFWEMVSELEVPVLVDTSPEGAELYPEYSQFGNSFTWRGFFSLWNAQSEDVGQTRPLRIVFAHGGGFLVSGEAQDDAKSSLDHPRFLEMVSQNANLYLDSSNEFFDEFVADREKKEEILTKKYGSVFDKAPNNFVFGSDYWMGLRAGDMSQYLARQLSLMSGFEKHRNDYFLNNALRLLGIHKNARTKHGEKLLIQYRELYDLPGVSNSSEEQ